MTVTVIREERSGQTHSHTWNNIIAADADGAAVRLPGAADRSVHVFGTFDSGTITIEGSNELAPVNWVAIHDTGGDPLTFTVNAMNAINENVLWVRPVLSGAGGSADVNVIILSRRTK